MDVFNQMLLCHKQFCYKWGLPCLEAALSGHILFAFPSSRISLKFDKLSSLKLGSVCYICSFLECAVYATWKLQIPLHERIWTTQASKLLQDLCKMTVQKWETANTCAIILSCENCSILECNKFYAQYVTWRFLEMKEHAWLTLDLSMQECMLTFTTPLRLKTQQLFHTSLLQRLQKLVSCRS